MFIACAKPLDPVLDVAGLSRSIFAPMTVMDIRNVKLMPEFQEAFLLRDPNRWIGAVTQYEPVKTCAASRLIDGLVHRPQASHNPHWIFVVGRQQHRVSAANGW